MFLIRGLMKRLWHTFGVCERTTMKLGLLLLRAVAAVAYNVSLVEIGEGRRLSHFEEQTISSKDETTNVKRRRHLQSSILTVASYDLDQRLELSLLFSDPNGDALVNGILRTVGPTQLVGYQVIEEGACIS